MRRQDQHVADGCSDRLSSAWVRLLCPSIVVNWPEPARSDDDGLAVGCFRWIFVTLRPHHAGTRPLRRYRPPEYEVPPNLYEEIQGHQNNASLPYRLYSRAVHFANLKWSSQKIFSLSKACPSLGGRRLRGRCGSKKQILLIKHTAVYPEGSALTVKVSSFPTRECSS